MSLTKRIVGLVVLALIAVATGAGMNSQRAIGTGVLGGMVTATVLAVFVTPLFYVLIARGLSSRGQCSGANGEMARPVSTLHAGSPR